MSDLSCAPSIAIRLFAAVLCVAWPLVLHGGDAAFAQTAAPPSGDSWPRAAFPLSAPAGQRYLEDAAGQPFLIHGDAAWSLIAQLTREDAEMYLRDRQARGFNALLVNLIEHHFSSHPPANAYGHQPFLMPGNFMTPNDDYFTHADWVVRRAADHGLLVLLAPAYLGYGGRDEGWYGRMVDNGPAKLASYGQYLGRRYRGFTNILWVHGGDYDPPRKDLVRAIANGIRDFDPRALHTVHCAPEKTAIECWKSEPWLQLNNIYTRGPVHIPALQEYARPERMPFFLIEGAYENEHGAGELRMRIQAYQAVLSGASGHFYGNNPTWHFDGPGLHPVQISWQDALGSSGARSMAYMRRLLARLPWWRLVPDSDGALLTDGAGSAQNRTVAAATDDGTVAILYMPSIRKVQVALDRLRGPRVRARWYDPTNGSFLEASAPPLAASGPEAFQPAHVNSAGMEDWVLLLESEP